MSKIKKLIALTLALAMVLSVSAFAGSYKADTYADAASINSDCKSAIELLYALDIMVGDGKNFNPESAVTRAEMAKMIYVILNYGDDDKAATYTGGKFFTDVEAGYWAEGYINYCAATKLIAGRGDNTFDPTAPVTTAEAAKMILTAIGYSAEHRGYTGANWDKNVLSDAAIIGLLDGYKANVNIYAPRQWVAVMFQNMLLDAYTFGNMAPNFSGLLISGVNVNGNGVTEDAYETMGEKYYDLYKKNVYAYATENAYIDQVLKCDTDHDHVAKCYTTYANEDYVLFSDGKQIKNTGLGALDLGQKYTVIARDNKALSVRLSGDSVVGEATVAELEWAYTYNKGDDTREFTIGDLTAPFAAAEINAISNNKTGKIAAYKQFGEDDLMKKQDDLSKDVIKAIDKNGDGEIDYLIIIYSDYAFVKKAGTDKSGDYVILQDVNYENIESKKSGKQWIGGAVDCEEELESGNYVKRTLNIDTQKYDLEVLPVVHDVKYTNKEGISKPVYTIGDVEYQLATKGFTQMNEMPARKSKVSVVYDEDLAVYVGKYVFTYTDIEDIYNQLGVFEESFKMNSTIRPNRNVDGVAYYNMVPELLEEEYDGTVIANTSENTYKLYAVDVDEEDGTSLTRLAGKSIADIRAALSADEELIAAFKTGKGSLYGKKDTFAFEESRSYKFDEAARFFVISKDGSKNVVEVMTIADIEEKTYNGVYAELFYSPADENGRQFIIGGLIDLRNPTYGTSNDYFFVTEIEDVEDIEAVKDEAEKTIGYALEVRVTFSDNTEDDIELFFDNEDAAKDAAEAIKLNALYGYTYNGDKDVYTLGELKEDICFDFDDQEFQDTDKAPLEITIDDLVNFSEIVLTGDYAISLHDDAVIALTIKHYATEGGHELRTVEHIFTDLAGWEEALGELSIVNGKVITTGEEVETYTCYSDVYAPVATNSKLLNICIYADDLWD